MTPGAFPTGSSSWGRGLSRMTSIGGVSVNLPISLSPFSNSQKRLLPSLFAPIFIRLAPDRGRVGEFLNFPATGPLICAPLYDEWRQPDRRGWRPAGPEGEQYLFGSRKKKRGR